MNPLETFLADLIAAEGPLRIDRYMALCLGHPRHGYYITRDPLGDRGDFITAPEVSQVFGELVGVWAVGAWGLMGQPDSFNLVELGPGRGTLMADVLRTVRKAAPGFAAAASVHLVETSPVLRARQREAVGEGATWHDRLEDVPEGPMILLANEFFDAIPIRQFERRDGVWRERVIGLTQDRLSIGVGGIVPGAMGKDGDVMEFAPARDEIARHIGARLAAHRGAALVIDYGHLHTAPGDTLQAMRAHRFVPVTETPGEADLTSHVDFEKLAHALGEGGAITHRGMTQRDFLLAMGLEQRVAQLQGKADAATREVLARQMARLADEAQMGNLFKLLCATSPGMSTPYPFG
ncbi:class I SAM-dependent methyltransferase [Aestuariivirga litoralis]|uniref:Class I SAM-dependent methyltransferase n=1 Tax=Aestuariivirga litoralis TaxID=2650924 RepID=A0A2W2B0I5_9HYPH|nr:SAM-dependent methyltransferase [Aestuariivirga litoralis]PZF78410.1 class I SAM-dependent methyltransferase [Aestuariivirga litoralis]